MSIKSNRFWQDFSDQMWEEYEIRVLPTEDSLRDLSDYYSKRKHKEVATEIEKRLIAGIYPPPEGQAPHLDAPDQMYGKIKKRTSGLRIIYLPYEEKGVHYFLILVVGPRADNEVYDILKKRLKENGRPEKR